MRFKICKRCDREKPLYAFDLGVQYKDGYRPICKGCLATQGKDRYRNPDRHRVARYGPRKLRHERMIG